MSDRFEATRARLDGWLSSRSTATESDRVAAWREEQLELVELVLQYLLDNPPCSLTNIAIDCLGCGSGGMRSSLRTKARDIVEGLEERGLVRRAPGAGPGFAGRPVLFFGVREVSRG